jgi:mRNA interferase RelE/StbE
MKIEFRESFRKDLLRIKDKHLYSKIESALHNIETAKSVEDISNLKKLKGYKEYFRIRVGDFMIGLVIVGGLVIVVRALHRKEIYRYFP